MDKPGQNDELLIFFYKLVVNLHQSEYTVHVDVRCNTLETLQSNGTHTKFGSSRTMANAGRSVELWLL